MSDYIDTLYLSGQEIPIQDSAAQEKIKELFEDQTGLKSDLEKLANGVEVISPEIFSHSMVNKQTGAIEETASDIARTDYIPVNAGETIWVNNAYASTRNCFYDGGRNFLSAFTIPAGQPASIAVPQNAAYMICCNSSVLGRMFTKFYRVAPFIDKTLAISGKAAEAKATGEKMKDFADTVTEAKNAVDDLKIDIGSTVTELPQTVTKSAGYMAADGEIGGVNNPTYFHTSQIPVKAGDVVLAQNASGNPITVRFLCAFSGDTADSQHGQTTESSAGYTVPEGITSVVLSCYYSMMDTSIFIIRRTFSNSDIRHNKNKWSVSASAASIAANSIFGIPNSNALYNKKNCSYSFWANFSDFSGLKIGHGTTSLGAGYIEITPTKLLAYQGNGSSAAVKKAEYDLPENFAFSDFISVNVNVNNLETPAARVTILSENQRFIQEGVPFVGCRGQVFAQPAAAMTNAVLSYSMRDLKSDVFIFGDSYTSLNDQNRWPYHVIQAGYTDYLLCGYPGAGAQDILPALQQMISLARPKYIVWLLGMNNADTETGYNENWKTALDSVLEICESIKATPILATIPNTPTVSNYYKNQYVRQSGYRYIDFAKAVGAEALESHWYTGMLNETETAKVHPTVYGARALAMRLLADLPEIT